MGLLGAKAWDADKPQPAPRGGSGRRRFKSSGRNNEDIGPKRLLIKAIFPGGPADKAGLLLGDIVVGVNQASFKRKGSFAVLATHLLAAESGKGNLTLSVERSGEDGAKLIQLKVKLEVVSKEAKTPTTGKGREQILRRALAWLVDRQSGDGSFPATLGGTNGTVVQVCLAGLAWISSGSNLKGGKYRKAIGKAYKFVLRGLEQGDPFKRLGRSTQGNWDQSTWAYAHAAIFLGELHGARKSKKLQQALQKIASVLVARQEQSGGYAHGPGGPNALGYVELNIVGGFVLTGLGLAQQAGCQVDKKVVDKLVAYLQQSGGGDGGVGYSTKPGQKGMGNIGRTAGAYLGSVALGYRRTKWCKNFEAWTRRNVANVLDGHASLMQHIMLAGVAANALGAEATNEYWKTLLRDFTLARAPDGSFQPRPWHESLSMQSNTDVTLGEVWTTASWAIVLGAGAGQKEGLPAWCGRKIK